jgi:low temperature requirement protein LtrA
MATARLWITPPRLRSAAAQAEERHATWLELFFDLVFVVAIARLAGMLVDDHALHGFLEFAALFVPVWWTWVNFTFYADRFDTDDVLFRVLMLVGMLTVGAIAVNVPLALDGGSTAFALSFVAARVVVLLLYARAWRHVVEARVLTNLYGSAFTLGGLLWLGSLALDPRGRYVVWAVALLLDMATPLVARSRIAKVPISASHIPERIGLLTIIVLGESVLAVVLGIDVADFGLRGVVIAVCAFAAVAAVWWIYFDYLDSGVVRRSIWAGQAYLYGHIPLLLGLTAVGAGTHLAIEEAAHGALQDGARWAVCGGLALCLASITAIHLTTTGTGLREPAVWWRLAAAGAALALAALTTAPLVLMLLLALVFLAVLVAEVVGHEGDRRQAALDAAQPQPTP